jgi:hypothetical protein
MWDIGCTMLDFRTLNLEREAFEPVTLSEVEVLNHFPFSINH